MAMILLEAGLAKLQTSFGSDRIPDVHLLARAELSAKQKRLKAWENYVEGQEVANGSTAEFHASTMESPPDQDLPTATRPEFPSSLHISGSRSNSSGRSSAADLSL